MAAANEARNTPEIYSDLQYAVIYERPVSNVHLLRVAKQRRRGAATMHGFIAGFWSKSEEERERGELIEIGGSFCNHRYFSFRLFCMSDDIGGSFIN